MLELGTTNANPEFLVLEQKVLFNEYKHEYKTYSEQDSQNGVIMIYCNCLFGGYLVLASIMNF